MVKKGGNMYDKHLKELEEQLDLVFNNMFGDDELSEIIRGNIDLVQKAADLADLIIKIKTIQMMDKSAGMLDESKKIMGNL